MNIEEYKLAIMKQLREPHSAMRCLMSQWKMRERRTKSIYRDNIEFVVPERELFMAFSKFELGRETCFSVRFEEIGTEGQSYPHAYDLKRYAAATRFHIEKIKFSHNIISMSIESHETWMNPAFIPYRADINDKNFLSFHLDGVNWQSPKRFTSTTGAWARSRFDNTYGFVDYDYDTYAEAQLKDFLEKSVSSVELRQEILNIFENAVGDEGCSPMFYIAHELNELFKKKKKQK